MTRYQEADMEFFVDTADVAEIREMASLGLLDGVTTNPSLIAKAGGDFKAIIAESRQRPWPHPVDVGRRRATLDRSPGRARRPPPQDRWPTAR